MLYTKDKNEDYEGITIELTLFVVFVSIEEVRPSTIIIDKHKMSLNSINKVISNDIHCWSFVNATKDQIAEKNFFYHFHMIKARSENLLIHILELDK